MSHRSVMIAIVLLASVLIDAIGIPATAQAECEDRLDLAAIALSSRDAELADFAHLGAFDESLLTESFIMAAYLGASPVDIRDLLINTGWQRKHLIQSARALDDSPGRYSQVVFSYVTEYCSAAGASESFAVLEDESASASASDLEPARVFGEETDLTIDAGLDADNRQFRSIDLSFRVRNHVAGVTVHVYPTLEGSAPDQQYVETLGAVLEQRLLRPPAPGPGFSLARMNPETAITFDDAYFRINGVDLPLVGESADAAATRTGSYANADDVYQLFQEVSRENAVTALYSLTVYQFPADEDAAIWLETAEDHIAANAYYAGLTELAGSGVTEEESRVFEFSPNDSGPTAVIVLVADGSRVDRVQLVPSTGITGDLLAAAEALMEAQATCAEAGTCVAIEVPALLTSVLEQEGDSTVGTPTAFD